MVSGFMTLKNLKNENNNNRYSYIVNDVLQY